jgi:hypothetical protein
LLPASCRKKLYVSTFIYGLVKVPSENKKKEQRAEDYLYSSVKNYAGEQGLLTVTILEGFHGDRGWKSGGWPAGRLAH